MLKVSDIRTIEANLGYTFNDKKLLKKAFSNKNKELVELGEKITTLVLYKTMYNDYLKVKDDYANNYMYDCFSNNDLSSFYSKVKDSVIYGRSFLVLGFDLFTDKKNFNNYHKLYLAIIGALTIDTVVNFEVLFNVINHTLDSCSHFLEDFYNYDYYSLKLNKWAYNKGYGTTIYNYNYLEDSTIECVITFSNNKDLKFSGTYDTWYNARRWASKNAYLELEDKRLYVNPISCLIGEPIEDKALEQLEYIVNAGLIEEPNFEVYAIDLGELEDEEEDVVYNVSFTIEELGLDFRELEVDSVEDGKRLLAYEYLRFLCDDFEEPYSYLSN